MTSDMVSPLIKTPTQQIYNPWLSKAGLFANDPTWNDFLEVLADYRRNLEEQKDMGLVESRSSR